MDNESKVLWLGEVEPWMDEGYVFHQMFGGNPEVMNIKLIKDKNTGQNAGYGFVTFRSHAVASQVLNEYNGKQVPNSHKRYRLNWGAHSASSDPKQLGGGGGGWDRTESVAEFTIFVGDLAADVTELMLQVAFQQRYSSVRGAKIITDPVTNAPKGYGFVRFGDEGEHLRAMVEMQGVYISTRPIRCSTAKKSNQPATAAPVSAPAINPLAAAVGTDYRSNEYDPALDPTNTTIFIGSLDLSATEEQVRNLFAAYGELVYCRCPPGKGCGFVQYMYRQHAEIALEHLNGMFCGATRMRLAWGRSATKSPAYGGATAFADPAASAYHSPYPNYYPYQQPQPYSQYNYPAGYNGQNAGWNGQGWNGNQQSSAAASVPNSRIEEESLDPAVQNAKYIGGHALLLNNGLYVRP